MKNIAVRPVWRAIALVGLLLLAAVALTGCAEPEAIAAVEPPGTNLPPTPTDVPLPPPKATPAALDFPLAPPSHVNMEIPDDRNCVACHMDAEILKAVAKEDQEILSGGDGLGGSLPPLDAWERVLISEESFSETLHGRYGCITCHGGTPGTGGKEAAHEGMVREPPSAEACGDCHPDEVAADAGSLHSTLDGFTTALSTRSAPDKMAQLEIMMDNHCDQCHTSCGQCHVSRPTNLQGGLVDGHVFMETPAVDLTCAGCHRSRIGAEYTGKNAGVPADVHWIQGNMSCFECHSADEMHGAMGEGEHRYAGATIPGCQDADCHPGVGTDDSVRQHTDFHFEAMSCQVCHSTTYQNCYGCHVAQQDGVPDHQIESSVLAFKIGRNPLQSEERPWEYVPLRHVPIDPESFAYYGENLLPNFDALPTWKYATPHNIQRITPQNETCQSCHGNAEFFLTDGDVLPGELEANEAVIVEELPFEIPMP
ncbi:MAG: hypothetical protein M8467_09335 [Anaerolineae bacterium]|nr:hypothetical protein [Anaerolineae bacterium]